MAPSATIIIPTRDRPDYLDVALTSIAGQARRDGAEMVVVDDGHDNTTEQVGLRHGARYVALGSPRGLNAARNAGIDAAQSELLIFVDDDVEVDPGWLSAYLDAAKRLPHVGVFTGPIHARLEGRAAQRQTCGREGAPITNQDHGDGDRDVVSGWGANLAIRAETFRTFGRFDEQLPVGTGDELEWEQHYLDAGGRIRYAAAAALYHRRAPADATLWALARAAARRGVTARRFDERTSAAPALRSELRTLAGCIWHTFGRRCANGPVLAAHSAGRLVAALRPQGPPTPAHKGEDFLSGESGTVGGRRDAIRALADAGLDVLALPTRVALARAARRQPPRREVLVISAARPERTETYEAAIAELRRTRHALTIAVRDAGSLGRFENFNLLLATQSLERFDWLLLLDDDVTLPRGFLDGFIHQAERHQLRLAQPAHRLRSHAAWRVTRRRARSVVRETAFVEIGPVTALHRDTLAVLLPFPPLRMGWGLDAHWSALARAHGWRMGVIDALPVAHLVAPTAAAYAREDAVAEARSFLSDHAYLPASELQRTLVVHRRCA